MKSAWILPLLAVAACGPPSGAQQGSLGNGYFSYGCVSTEDAYCPDLLDRQPFPANVAQGARFEVTFVEDFDLTRGEAYGVLHVEAVSPEMLASAGETFETRLSGRAGLLAATADGRVVDTTTIHVVAPASVAFTGDDGKPAPTAASLAAGGSLSIHATPLGELDARLAGVLVCTATTTDAAVVSVPSKACASPLALTANAAGKATVVVTCGGASTTLALEVR